MEKYELKEPVTVLAAAKLDNQQPFPLKMAIGICALLLLIFVGTWNHAWVFTSVQSLDSISHWNIIAGLIVGGIVAAPIAAYASKRLPTKVMMMVVGALIILVSIRIIYLTVR